MQAVDRCRLLEGKGGQRRVAAARAIRFLRMLRRRGYTARVVGSVATGRFNLISDVNFLVKESPGDQIWKIESAAMDIMGNVEFDLSYRDEVRERILQNMEECVMDEWELLRAIRKLQPGR
jgi:predicted nucleotidyltransferase